MYVVTITYMKWDDEIISTTSTPPTGGDFVWDGNDDEDDRPLSQTEMLQGSKNKGGRPRLSNPKKSTTIMSGKFTISYYRVIVMSPASVPPRQP